MADIFISYSREDREWVGRFANALTRADFSVWWDRKIDLGAEYDMVIEQELNVAQATIVVWSVKAAASSWVRAEARKSLDLKTYFPIVREKVALPFRFEGYQTADFTHWNGDPDAAEMKEFLGVLRERLHHEDKPAATAASAGPSRMRETSAVAATPIPPTASVAPITAPSPATDHAAHPPPIVQNFFKGLATPKPVADAPAPSLKIQPTPPAKSQPVRPSVVSAATPNPVAVPGTAKPTTNLPIFIVLGVAVLLLVGLVIYSVSKEANVHSVDSSTTAVKPLDDMSPSAPARDDASPSAPTPDNGSNTAADGIDHRDAPPSGAPVQHDPTGAIGKH